jgi:hypothetical protein
MFIMKSLFKLAECAKATLLLCDGPIYELSNINTSSHGLKHKCFLIQVCIEYLTFNVEGEIMQNNSTYWVS